jgi:hypothetical protein
MLLVGVWDRRDRIAFPFQDENKNQNQQIS